MAKSKRPAEGSRPERRIPLLDDVSVQDLLGRVVIAWNNFEAICRSLLNELCGNSPGIDALTAELGGLSLYNALRAAVPKSNSPELTPVIDELAEGLDRLREHRNYYIHGSSSVSGPSGSESLTVKTSDAKTAVRAFEDDISKQDLYLVSADCDDLALYAFDLWAHLRLKKLGRQTEWPDMPFLPPKLARSPRR